jgi:hypothetical protein
MSFLALRGTEVPIFIVGIVFLFIYLMTRVTAREREQRRRMELIERALESGSVDESIKKELLAAVTDKRRPGHRTHPVFLLGWVGLCAGVGMMVIALNYSYWWEPAILTTAISFGVLSVPIAAREIQSRRHA